MPQTAYCNRPWHEPRLQACQSPWRSLAASVALAMLGGLGSAQAQSLSLDFGNAPGPVALCTTDGTGVGSTVNCASGYSVLQSYGDVAGVVDVRYTDVLNPTQSLRWWDSNYNQLYGVLWANGSDSSSHARIDLIAAEPDAWVTLQGFQLGAYSNNSRSTELTVSALDGGAVLYSYSGLVGELPANLATSFAPNVGALGGLRIEWRNSAYNVGIDNIAFSVSAVPEPGAFALMLVGTAVLLARRRRA